MKEPTEKVSYSKLMTYVKCPELFRQTYFVEKNKGQKVIEEALIKGNLAHLCIEKYLKGEEDKELIIEQVIPDWLLNICQINPAFTADEGDIGLGVELENLIEYATKCGHLLYRCSGEYTLEDKIRNKDGSIPVNPLEYPPRGFKYEYDKDELFNLKFRIDNQAVRVNNFFQRISLANIAAQAVSYLYIFRLPEFIKSVNNIELNLSYKKVGFNNNRYYWNGLIDTEYTTTDGTVILNDHKTEKSKRRSEDVLYDLQLNSYAAVRYEQTGKIVDYISITHLPTNTIIAAELDKEVMVESMEYLEEIQEEINRDIEERGVDRQWHRVWPTKYGSPCLKRDWKSGALESVCPYIRECWGGYYSCIEEEVDQYLGKNKEEDRIDSPRENEQDELNVGRNYFNIYDLEELF